MKQLPIELKKNSYTYRQLERTESKAIYEQRMGNKIIAYEVFLIKSHDGYTLAGNYIEPAETYPHNEAFGVSAWTVMPLARAMEKYTNLCTEKPN